MPDRAIELYDRYLAEFPAHADVLYDRGVAFEMRKEYDRALLDYDAALASFPDHRLALNNRGVVLARLDRTEEAVVSLRRLLELEPQDLLAWKNLGLTYHQRGELDEAIKVLQDAEEFGVDAELHYLRGRTLLALGQVEQAEELFTKVVLEAPDQGKAWLNRGICRLRMGQQELGLADLAETRRRDEEYALTGVLDWVEQSIR
jgi:tetratricopeptide (TPR) repeat protein